MAQMLNSAGNNGVRDLTRQPTNETEAAFATAACSPRQ